MGDWNVWVSCRDGDLLTSGVRVRGCFILGVQTSDEQPEPGAPAQKQGSQAEDHCQPCQS